VGLNANGDPRPREDECWARRSNEDGAVGGLMACGIVDLAKHAPLVRSSTCHVRERGLLEDDQAVPTRILAMPQRTKRLSRGNRVVGGEQGASLVDDSSVGFRAGHEEDRSVEA
jgi:hypothetical protein